MSHWQFILGAYGATLLVIVVEILAVRARRRDAARTAAASGPRQNAPRGASDGSAR